MTPQRVLVAVRDPALAGLLRRALADAGLTVIGRINPAQHAALFERPALADAVVMEAGELRTIRRRRSFLRRLHPAIRLVAATTNDRLADLFSLAPRVDGLLIVDAERGIGRDEIALALSGYCVLPEQVLERLLGLDWRRVVAERLDAQEQRVLRLLGAGSRNSEIATAIGCSEGRVKTLVRSVLDKLGIANRTVAGVIATRISRSGRGGASRRRH